jgi:hypothetical protein
MGPQLAIRPGGEYYRIAALAVETVHGVAFSCMAPRGHAGQPARARGQSTHGQAYRSDRGSRHTPQQHFAAVDLRCGGPGAAPAAGPGLAGPS